MLLVTDVATWFLLHSPPSTRLSDLGRVLLIPSPCDGAVPYPGGRPHCPRLASNLSAGSPPATSDGVAARCPSRHSQHTSGHNESLARGHLPTGLATAWGGGRSAMVRRPGRT